MKTLCLLLSVCIIAAAAPAQYRPHPNSYEVTEKRFVTVVTPGDPFPFLLDTTNGDLWKLASGVFEWVYIGDPRGANNGRPGKFKLLPFASGEVLILDTENGETWWTNGTEWKELKKPSTIKRRYKSPFKSWDEKWEDFKKKN